jgi:hypothetical protein
LHLFPVPSPEVEANWHFAEAWVRSALEDRCSTENAGRLKEMCLERAAQLWLIQDFEQVVGAIVTEIVETTNGLTCNLITAAGSFRNDGDMCLDIIERWARAEGCVRLELTGRAGWQRCLKPHRRGERNPMLHVNGSQTAALAYC